MGMKLVVPEDDIKEGATTEKLYMEAAFDLNYDIANWLECMCCTHLPRSLFTGRARHYMDSKQVLGFEAFRTGEL